MAMMMPPAAPGQPAVPPVAPSVQPFPGQSTPERRDRTVRAPGTRGGHYRRVWSERKHKWYVKYGDAPTQFKVGANVPLGAEGNQASPPQGSAPVGGNPPSESQTTGARAGAAIFQSFYTMFLEAFELGEKGSGINGVGRKASFGQLTPLHGQIITLKSKELSIFRLLDENDDVIEKKRQDMVDREHQREFFCFMAARYATIQYLEQTDDDSQEAEKQEDPNALQSLGLQSGEQDPELEPVRRSLWNMYRVIKGGFAQQITPKEPPSALPRAEIMNLQKNVEELRASRRQGRAEHPLAKKLEQFDKIISRLEKSWQDEEPLIKANPLGRLRGSAGGGRSQTAVFRRPGRPPGTSQNLSIASPGMGQPAQRAPVKESKEDWQNHKDLKIGARVRIHHPHKHEKPAWGRIIAIGKDGVSVAEDNGSTTNIRWVHIHDIMPRLDNTPQNSFEMTKFGLPMENVPMAQKHERDLADRILRRFGMPHNDDVIHDGHDGRQAAYAHLIETGAPIDVIEATRAKTKGKSPLDAFKGNLVDAAIARKVPVDPDLLRKLPLESVVEVLHHHMNEGEK